MKPRKHGLAVLVMLIFVWGSAFSLPEIHRPELSPYARYRLSRIPLIRRFVKPPTPPEKAYQETRRLVEKLREEGADIYAPDLFSRVEKKWERARTYYRTGHYEWAETYFREIAELGRKALEETRRRREARKRAAEEVLKKLRRSFEARRERLSPEKRLRIALALWRLELLIQLEQFEDFRREARRISQTYGL